METKAENSVDGSQNMSPVTLNLWEDHESHLSGYLAVWKHSQIGYNFHPMRSLAGDKING